MSEQQGFRVLVVDDMRINRIILSSLLESNGVTSDQAESGNECLQLCRENPYDLILLDQRMPDMDGVETLVQLKEIFLKNGRDVPVICHTTEDARRNISLYKAAGFADVLVKPIQPQELSEILMTYLPGGREVEEKKRAKEIGRLEEEKKRLPEWVFSVPGLSVDSGLKHCETAEDFLETLSVFAASIVEKSTEIENFFKSENWKMYTLRVHSLKSMCRLIGAEVLAEIAADLEYAGKQADVEVIRARTSELLAEYRVFIPALADLMEEGEDNHESDGSLPEIPEDTLADAYSAIFDFAACYDTENIRMVLESLREFQLQDKEAATIQGLDLALSNSDWEGFRRLLEYSRMKTILVIDEDNDFLRVMNHWLGGAYKMDGVRTGADALLYLDRVCPDLILLDFEMAQMDGYQVMDRLQGNSATAHVPIIFLTGRDDRESVMRSSKRKPDGYLLKAMRKEELLDALDRFFHS